MNLLVTGGAGFIGSNFIHYWLDENPEDEVVNLDLLTYAGNLENLKDVENNPNYSFIKGDITNKELVEDVIREHEIDTIVHFAAESHVDRSIMNCEDFVHTNVVGTYSLLEQARDFNLNFHHVSTDEVFGELDPEDPPFDENTDYDPQSPYAASKAGSDHLVRSYHNTYDLEVTISNCSNNYGPYQFPEKIIPLFISNLMTDEKVPVYGDGKQRRDWIHVDDHSRGVEKIIKDGESGETYCLGGDSEMTNLELTKTLLELMDKDESYIKHVKDRPGHDRRYAIDFSKAKEKLGWEPQIEFRQGLKNTIEWYEQNQEWVKRCKSGEYRDYYKQQYKKR
ncbi:MAG: dTDP-glucose 4,6-dehydratase [Candidatus Magasanikbacteria bacterium]